MAHVTPTGRAEPFDLLWRLLEMAPALYDRCDDSNGTIGNVICSARSDLGAVAGQGNLDPRKLADRVFQGVCATDYAQLDGLIGLMAQSVGRVDCIYSRRCSRNWQRSRPQRLPMKIAGYVAGLRSVIGARADFWNA
jgi:hypothetical protein